MAKDDKELSQELEIVELALVENRILLKKMRSDLLNVETILIGNKLRREKLVEELRRLRLNSQ